MISPGQKLGRYHLREPLGSGGMAAVYRAYDPVLDREIALKILPPELARDETLRTRFQEEARALAKVEHANLVRIFAIGQEGPVSFYAMELIAGRTLGEVMAVRGRFAPSEAAAVMSQLLAGLSAVHAAGIVHRDLKPGNIMLDAAGRVVLMDFGLARRVERQSVTSVGAVLGTPEYMSPEQARGASADARSDLYSVGVVLFEMLAGVPPFSGKDTIAILRQHVETPAPPLRRRAPDAPPALDRIVARLLAKAPEDRYPHVEAVAADLAACAPVERSSESVVQDVLASIAGLSTRPTRTAIREAMPPTPPAAPAQRAPARTDRLRTAVAVASAVIAVLSLLVAIYTLLWVQRPAAAPAERPPESAPETHAAGSSVEWRVTRRDGRQLTGRAAGFDYRQDGAAVWTFTLPDGGVERVPANDILRMEKRERR